MALDDHLQQLHRRRALRGEIAGCQEIRGYCAGYELDDFPHDPTPSMREFSFARTAPLGRQNVSAWPRNCRMLIALAPPPNSVLKLATNAVGWQGDLGLAVAFIDNSPERVYHFISAARFRSRLSNGAHLGA